MFFRLIQVMANQEAVDIAKKIKDPQKAAKQIVVEALNRESKDDISCIVVRFRGWKHKRIIPAHRICILAGFCCVGFLLLVGADNHKMEFIPKQVIDTCYVSSM